MDSAWEQKKLEAGKMLENEDNPHRPMHDVFGSAFLLFSTNNF